ncbi:MAG: hypothetical protein PVI33_01160 [Candidatus Omnitrophota bacterium]|jgi:hypothetical protein
MEEKGPLTPERELLKIIEEPGTKVKAPSIKARQNFFSLFSPIALKARFSFLKARFKGGVGLKWLSQLEIKTINRILELCIFVLIFYLVSNFAISMINLNKDPSLAFEINEASVSSALVEASLLKADAYYLGKARTRDIFKMGLTSVADAEQITEVPVSGISEAVGKLKLVGISWSDDPDIIIEDTQVQRAYFLKRGQKINDFTVKAVFKDKVILSYNEEEVELK